MVADVDYLEKIFFYFFDALVPPVIIGSSNSSSAWVVCLFSLKNHPRVGLVIQHRGILNFSSSVFPQVISGQPMYF